MKLLSKLSKSSRSIKSDWRVDSELQSQQLIHIDTMGDNSDESEKIEDYQTVGLEARRRVRNLIKLNNGDLKDVNTEKIYPYRLTDQYRYENYKRLFKENGNSYFQNKEVIEKNKTQINEEVYRIYDAILELVTIMSKQGERKVKIFFPKDYTACPNVGRIYYYGDNLYTIVKHDNNQYEVIPKLGKSEFRWVERIDTSWKFLPHWLFDKIFYSDSSICSSPLRMLYVLLENQHIKMIQRSSLLYFNCGYFKLKW